MLVNNLLSSLVYAAAPSFSVMRSMMSYADRAFCRIYEAESNPWGM